MGHVVIRAWLSAALLLASFVVLGSAAPAGAAPGDLDPSLGSTGQVVTDLTGHFAQASGLALQPDGRAVVAGTAAPHAIDEAADFALARYGLDGELDPTFGSAGTVTTDLFGERDEAGAVALQPDGMIVVAGSTAGYGPTQDFALVRYGADGTLDPTFGRGGIALTDIGTVDVAFSVAVQPDGKILVGGGADSSFVVARYLPDGSPDLGFGGSGIAWPGVFGAGARITALVVLPGGEIVGFGPASGDFYGFRLQPDGFIDYGFGIYGVVQTDLEERDDEPSAISPLPDGRLVVAGRSGDDLAVVRYQPWGDLDPTFGGTGYVLVNLSEGTDEARAAIAFDGGGVLAAGAAGADFALVRFLPDGSLDPGLDGDGIAVADFAGGPDAAAGLALRPTGEAVLAGTARTAFGDDFALTQFTGAGAPSGRKVTTDLAAASDRASAVGIDAQGRVVTAGYSATAEGWDFALARHGASGGSDTRFGVDGRVVTDSQGGDDRAHAMAFTPDGRIVLAGQSAEGGESVISLARYRQDGTLDQSFGFGGQVRIDLVEGTAEQGAGAVTVLPDGRTVFAGFVGNDLVVGRLAVDGSLDETFGFGGTTFAVVFGEQPRANAIAVDSQGRIVVVGDVTPGGSESAGIAVVGRREVVVARLLPGGALDESFGFTGIVHTRFGFGTTHDEGRAVAVQPDDQILVAGRTVLSFNGPGGVPPSSDIGVIRLLEDGSRDFVFGGSAETVIFDSGGLDVANAIALQPDGSIVLAGQMSGDLAALRLLQPMGFLDPTFGGDGIATADFGGGIDDGRGVALGPGGSVVVAGTAGAGAGSRLGIARFDPGGVLDGSFGAGGQVTTSVVGDADRARALAVQPDGKVVAAGEARSGPAGVFALVRYLPDGSLDPTFGAGGRVTTDISNGPDSAFAVVVQPDGRLVVAGRAGDQFGLVRYLPDGSVDPSFGDGGIVTTGIGEGRAQARAVLLRPDGRIVAVGLAARPPGEEAPALHDFMVTRYLPDGQLDGSFAGDGLVLTDVSGSADEAYAAALQPDGRLVVAGQAGNQVAAVRYTDAGALDGSFGAGGMVTVEVGEVGLATAVALRPDGRVVLAGEALRADRDVVVVGLDAAGALDPSFGAGGLVFAGLGPDDRVAAVAVLPDGALLVGGHVLVGTGPVAVFDVALYRFDVAGLLDARFGAGGVAVGGVTGFGDDAAAMSVLADGRIVVAGAAVFGPDDVDFTLLRFLGGAIGGDADLAVALTAPVTAVSLVGPFRYLLTVRNLGPTLATDVVVVVELPPALVAVGGVSSQGLPCLITTGRLACPLGSVPAGGAAGVTVLVQASLPGTHTAGAFVTGSQPDPQPANDTASVAVVVQPPSARANPAVVAPGRVVSVIGAGFQPGVALVLGYPGQPGQRVVVPAADGSFVTPLVVFPNTTLGPRLLEARAAATVLAQAKILVVADSLAPPNFAGRG